MDSEISTMASTNSSNKSAEPLNVAERAQSLINHEGSVSNRRGFKVVICVVVPLFVLGFMAGAFILVSVHNAILLFVVTSLFGGVLGILVWNAWCGRDAVVAFLLDYSDSDLSRVMDGQYVKVTGDPREPLPGVIFHFPVCWNSTVGKGHVVSCGNVPLESSYEKVSRCIYTSTRLYEHMGWKARSANPKHWHFSWELAYLETYVTDFYISDLQSGLRALVKAGSGAKVTPYVEETTVINIVKKKELSSFLAHWLRERNLSSEDRLLRLKEGYVKEGSMVTVMGVVRRTDNIITIVPPSEPFSTGCQWTKFFLPTNIEGIVLRYDDTSMQDVKHV